LTFWFDVTSPDFYLIYTMFHSDDPLRTVSTTDRPARPFSTPYCPSMLHNFSRPNLHSVVLLEWLLVNLEPWLTQEYLVLPAGHVVAHSGRFSFRTAMVRPSCPYLLPPRSGLAMARRRIQSSYVEVTCDGCSSCITGMVRVSLDRFDTPMASRVFSRHF